MRRPVAEQLKAAAGALCAERGYDAVSLAAIRERAKVSNGSVYHVFSSKEAVYLALYRDLLAKRTAVIRTVPAESREAAKAVRALIEKLVAFAAGHQVNARVLMMLDTLVWSPELRGAAGEAATEARHAVTSWAKPLIADGKMKRLPPDLLAVLLLGPVDAYIHCAIDPLSGAVDAGQVVALADAVWRALRKDEEPVKDPVRTLPKRRTGKAADKKEQQWRLI